MTPLSSHLGCDTLLLETEPLLSKQCDKSKYFLPDALLLYGPYFIGLPGPSLHSRPQGRRLISDDLSRTTHGEAEPVEIEQNHLKMQLLWMHINKL